MLITARGLSSNPPWIGPARLQSGAKPHSPVAKTGVVTAVVVSSRSGIVKPTVVVGALEVVGTMEISTTAATKRKAAPYLRTFYPAGLASTSVSK